MKVKNKIFIGANFCVPPLFCRKNGWLCVKSNGRHADGDVMRNREAKTFKVLLFDKWAQCSRMRPFGENIRRFAVFPSKAVARFFVCTKQTSAHRADVEPFRIRDCSPKTSYNRPKSVDSRRRMC